MKAYRYTIILDAVLGLCLALIPFVLFPVCEVKDSPMGCFYSGVFITVMGMLVIAFSLLALRKKFRSLSVILAGSCAILSWLVPNRIITFSLCSLCADPSHACRASAMPAAGIIIAAIVILSSAALILDFIGGR